MDDAKIQDSIITHLQQAYAMERAQVGELRTLADEMEVPAIAAELGAHAEATRRHGDRLEARLEELDAGRSLRLLAQSYGAAIPKALIDRLRPLDTLATLRDATAAEAGEVAAYLLLEAEAIRGGDEATAVLAAELRAEEVDARDALMGSWNQAVDHQLDELAERSPGLSRSELAQQLLVDHLQDIHALERNAVIMLSTVLATVDDELATERVQKHRSVTSRHGDELSRRLVELGSRPSLRKQAQGYAFAAVKGPINLVRAEKAGKDLRDMYVVEYFELVAYSQLAVIAARAGDDATLRLAESHRLEEAAMADWLERESARFLLETLRAKA